MTASPYSGMQTRWWNTSKPLNFMWGSLQLKCTILLVGIGTGTRTSNERGTYISRGGGPGTPSVFGRGFSTSRNNREQLPGVLRIYYRPTNAESQPLQSYESPCAALANHLSLSPSLLISFFFIPFLLAFFLLVPWRFFFFPRCPGAIAVSCK